MNLPTISLFNSKKYPYEHKNVKIENAPIPTKAREDLYYATDTIGNYMQSKKASVRFFDPREMLGELDSGKVVENLSQSVGIEVKTKKTKEPKFAIVNYFSNPEKPFLRKIYESLQTLVEGKNSPIENHTKETMTRLIKSGKIKA